jgi:glycosyltransferase involved in cell wall biosynthesis
MKILIICDLFPPDVKGGYELRCEEACRWLNQNGYQVEVLTTKSQEADEECPFPVHRLLMQYPLGATPSNWTFGKKIFFAIRDNLIFKKVLRRSKPDIIYVWNCTGISRSLIPNIFSSEVRKIVDVSSTWLLKVSSQHGPIYRIIEGNHQEYLNKIFIFFLKSLLPFVSLNTIQRKYDLDLHNADGYFTSRWNKQFHTEYLEECKKFKVISTGIDPKEFPYYEKNIDPSIIRLLYIGRISKEKGFLLLLDQLDYLRSNSNKKFVLTIIGTQNNDEKNIIEETIVRLGLERMMIFKGQIGRDKLFEYYHQADFTVFPSIWDEPFSRVPLESMASGTPCISTDNPGSKELFELKAPLLLLERSKDGLSKSLNPFLQKWEDYQKVSFSGRKFVEESFTFDNFMKNVQKQFFLQ